MSSQLIISGVTGIQVDPLKMDYSGYRVITIHHDDEATIITLFSKTESDEEQAKKELRVVYSDG